MFGFSTASPLSATLSRLVLLQLSQANADEMPTPPKIHSLYFLRLKDPTHRHRLPIGTDSPVDRIPKYESIVLVRVQSKLTLVSAPSFASSSTHGKVLTNPS